MKPSESLELHRAAIRRIVEKHRARNPRVFGSTLYHEDTDESDLDLLVDTIPRTPTTRGTSLLDLAKIVVELQELLGVRVDVRTPRELPESFREEVVLEAAPV